MRHRHVQTNGITLHCVESGEGPLVLLLHGFPEFWYGWRRQIPGLVDRGFRVVAPDLRGYGLSDRPQGVQPYRIAHLVRDVAGLIASLGEREAVVVGHDWGGIVGWYTAMLQPEVVRRLIVLNAPHPAAYARELRAMSSQVWRSWYAGFHQLPWLPEAVWLAGDLALLRRVVAHGPAVSPEEREAYAEAYSSPGAMTAALNYYRAAFRHRPPKVMPIQAPTLLIWGERDPYLVTELTEGLDRWVADLRVQLLPHAGHWVQHEEPERVTDLIAEFAAE